MSMNLREKNKMKKDGFELNLFTFELAIKDLEFRGLKIRVDIFSGAK